MEEYEDLPPNFKQTLMEKVPKVQPLWNFLGIKLVDIKKGWARLKLPYSEKIIQPYGAVHGGAIFSLADSAFAMALIGLTERGERFTTIEMKINYIRPFTKGEVTADAKIIDKVRRYAIGDVTIINDSGLLVAKSIGTYSLTVNGGWIAANLKRLRLRADRQIVIKYAFC